VHASRLAWLQFLPPESKVDPPTKKKKKSRDSVYLLTYLIGTQVIEKADDRDEHF
jgi:hypothetical protein